MVEVYRWRNRLYVFRTDRDGTEYATRLLKSGRETPSLSISPDVIRTLGHPQGERAVAGFGR